MTTESKESADQFYKRTVFELCDLLHCYPSILVDTIKESHSAFTAPVSPLPLWGTNPRIRKTLREDYFWAWTDEVMSFSKRGFEDEQAAVIDWNRIAEALNEVEK